MPEFSLVKKSPKKPDTTRPFATARSGLGTVADVISVLSALATTWALLNGPVPQAILAILLGLIALSFMALSFHLQRQQAMELAKERRRSRHSHSAAAVAESATTLRDATANLALGAAADAFNEPAKQAAAKMAEGLSSATGVKCRVVIKTIYAPGGRQDVAVKTFVTSETSPARRKADGVIDWVKENTDFDEIFYQNRDFFLSNDLSKDLVKGYRNSHFTKEVLDATGFPYLSTLVWPIYGPKEVVGSTYDVVGFLCVDTKEAESFDEQNDVHIGQTMAALWFLALQRYSQIYEKNRIQPSPESEPQAKTPQEPGLQPPGVTA